MSNASNRRQDGGNPYVLAEDDLGTVRIRARDRKDRSVVSRRLSLGEHVLDPLGVAPGDEIGATVDGAVLSIGPALPDPIATYTVRSPTNSTVELACELTNGALKPLGLPAGTELQARLVDENDEGSPTRVTFRPVTGNDRSDDERDLRADGGTATDRSRTEYLDGVDAETAAAVRSSLPQHVTLGAFIHAVEHCDTLLAVTRTLRMQRPNARAAVGVLGREDALGLDLKPGQEPDDKLRAAGFDPTGDGDAGGAGGAGDQDHGQGRDQDRGQGGASS